MLRGGQLYPRLVSPLTVVVVSAANKGDFTHVQTWKHPIRPSPVGGGSGGGKWEGSGNRIDIALGMNLEPTSD